MKKYFVWLLIGVLGYACNQENQTEKTLSENTDTMTAAAETEAETEKIPDLSIYNLPTTWTTQDNEEIKLEDLYGDVLVMTMIYTTCPTACPRLIADMKYVESLIPEEDADKVKFVTVSIDPETDTPQRLKEFAEMNNMVGEKWVFLRGTPDDTREFANVLAVSYKKISPMQFSHSNIISVFDEKGVMVFQKEGLNVDYHSIVEAVKKEIHN